MAEKKPTPCYLSSRANYPITISYDGTQMILPANARKFRIADANKLGVLPNNVRKTIIKGDN